jgi:hypothetical protein
VPVLGERMAVDPLVPLGGGVTVSGRRAGVFTGRLLRDTLCRPPLLTCGVPAGRSSFGHLMWAVHEVTAVAASAEASLHRQATSSPRSVVSAMALRFRP